MIQLIQRLIRWNTGYFIAANVVALSFNLTSSAVAQSTPVNFGSVDLGTSSIVLPVVLTFSSSGTIGSTAVVTQGASGLDFVDAGNGTCTANMSYSNGQTCAVNVTFSPKFAGTRYGAAVAYDANGNVVATGYMQGTGLGPQVRFMPSTETTIINSDLYPKNIATDGAGNLYILDANTSTLIKATPGVSGGGYSITPVTTVLGAYGVAVDGAGNVYIGDTGNQRLLKEVPSASGYIETTIASGFGYPMGIAVDAAGNVFAADQLNDRILKFAPSSSEYTQTTVVESVPNAYGVAVDGSGSLYVAAVGYFNGSSTNSAVYKETLTPDGYVQSTFPGSGQIQPISIAVDGTGNVYVVDGISGNIYEETPTQDGYVERMVISDLTAIGGSFGVAVDGASNLYIGYAGGHSIVKADFGDPPTLNFASTPAGTTSADSPLTVTLANGGNAPLAIEIPPMGSNPSISPNFTLDSGNAAACPILTNASTSQTLLPPGTSCLLPISYTPEGGGPVAGNLTIVDNSLNAPAPAYTSHSIELNGTDITPSFTIKSDSSSISLDQGSSITSVLKISGQAGYSVNVTLSVSGLPSGVTASVSQNPARDTSILTLTASNSASPGSATVTITGAFGSEVVTTTIALKVNYVIPFFLSAAPQNLTILRGFSGTSNITVTDLLGFNGAVDFTATGLPAGVTAQFSPNPATSGTVLTLNANTSVPTGRYLIQIAGTAGTFGTSYAVVLLTVSATPQITWQNPSPITFGTALSKIQLNASTVVPGVFGYAPDIGAILGAGRQPLSVFFTPDDAVNYTTASAMVYLTVNKATPMLLWPTPAPVSFGTALSATQLNATANVPGKFVYTPAAGTIPAMGTDTLSVTFTPDDTANYATTTATAELLVNPATIAAITSPVSGSTLTGATTTFTWTPGSNATGYYLWVGTSPGTFNLVNVGPLNATSYAASLPTTGATVYVRLWSVINGKASVYSDYSYAEYNQVAATITSPVNGTTLSSGSTTFTWNAGSGTTGYYLWIGSSPGTFDIVNVGPLNTTSYTANLPTSGATIYVRLWSVINGKASQYSDSVYTESNLVRAGITSPVNGSTLAEAKTTFVWTPGSNATGYYLWVGTSPGTYNLANLGQFTTTSATVTVPTNGATIYVRLWSVINGRASQYTDYVYTAYNAVSATMTSPVNGSTLPGARTTFTWTPGSNATGYYLWVGTSPGTYNLANLGQFTTTSVTVTLPTNGSALYVRLWSVVDGRASVYSDYTYAEATQ